MTDEGRIAGCVRKRYGLSRGMGQLGEHRERHRQNEKEQFADVSHAESPSLDAVNLPVPPTSSTREGSGYRKQMAFVLSLHIVSSQFCNFFRRLSIEYSASCTRKRRQTPAYANVIGIRGLLSRYELYRATAEQALRR